MIYLPKTAGGAAGIHQAIVTRLGGVPKPHRSTLIPQATDALAIDHAERGRSPSWSSTRPIYLITNNSKP
ncbi:hypothetical protein [Streptomyces sp. NPDC003480]